MAAPGMLGAGATPGDLLDRRREFSPPDLVEGGGEAGMAVEMKSKLSCRQFFDKSKSVRYDEYEVFFFCSLSC